MTRLVINPHQKDITWRCLLFGHSWREDVDAAGVSIQCRWCERFGWPG